MITQKQLYLHNQKTISRDVTGFGDDYRDYEARWVRRIMAALVESDTVIGALSRTEDLIDALDLLVRQEAATDSEEMDYVAAHMTRDEFRVLVQEFALDGLTEAQSFYYVMPRLSLSAQLPMLRILIDEFGSANAQRMHTALYVALLDELQMPTQPPAYIDVIDDAAFAFVNQFYWLTLRAEHPSYFAGAITYLESSIPSFFPCYVKACRRLGIRAHQYYSEHCHIDHFHALEGRRVLQAMAREGDLNLEQAWCGARFTQHVTQDAFTRAVNKARAGNVPTHKELRDAYSAI